MRLNILCFFLAVFCLCSYGLSADGYHGGGYGGGYGGGCNTGCNTGCSDPCATTDTATAPQPAGDLPTVCYKPYRYYTPKYSYTCECDDVTVPCKKKCCRMVPKYYDQTYCKYEPKYYSQTYCKYEPEYYYEDDCRHVKQYHYDKHCSYEPHTYYQKECANTCGGGQVYNGYAPSNNGCAPAYNNGCAPAYNNGCAPACN
ncbi:MAG: hypothetical protein WC222_10565 [Parachlamydiales bacterium]